MRQMQPRVRRDRWGFTLIELLVVMMIIIILATITIAFLPKITEQSRPAKGADMLQGWLLIAKQRAFRDQTPTGIRLMELGTTEREDPNLALSVNNRRNIYFNMQFVQQPDDFWGGPASELTSANGTSANFSGVDLTGGTGNNRTYPVQPGDFLEIHRGGPVYRITSVSTSRVSLASQILQNVGVGNGSPTKQYRIIRSPRLLSGEPTLKLPAGVAIDLNAVPQRYLLPRNSATGHLEIVFSPSGGVVGWGAGKERLMFWIRDITIDPSPSKTNYKLGMPTLICVNVTTGSIAAHPVKQSGNDPFDFATDSRSSGM